MAMSVVYTSWDGGIAHENRGGVERDYGRDGLGSTVALYDPSQNKTDEYRYWPYGEEAQSTGTSPTPFRFVGTLGYYRDSASRTYVRARHYLQKLARWLTVDPLWPRELAYAYVEDVPSFLIDPTGLGSDPWEDYCRGWDEWSRRLDLWKRLQDLFVEIGYTGRNRFNHKMNPIGFEYGNCCGYNRKCTGDSRGNPSDTSLNGGKPVDCLDQACNNHDGSIPSVFDWLNGSKHFDLCGAAQKCDCSKDWPAGSVELDNCNTARKAIVGMFCSVGIGFPWW